MITFNSILRDENIDLKRVYLIRHRDTTHRDRPTIYSLWAANDETFELYQRIWTKKRFKSGNLLASFAVTPRGQTLFVGLYKVNGHRKARRGEAKDPTSQKDVGGKYLYDIRLDQRLASYRGHLTVDWGRGFIAYVQRAARNDKVVLEIRKEVVPPIFPGFSQFCWDVDQIKKIPSAWQEVLSSVKGVYVLVCKHCGKQYVGSAKGEENLWQRLVNYAETNHGGNVELKRHGPRRYQASILEVVNSGFGIEKIEEDWKRKLLTRKFGLN